MQIVFGTAGLAFHGHSLKEGSLGGSETALICMAKAFAAMGHDVRVYCECRQPGVYDGVQYFHHREFPSHVVNLDIDVLIASRWVDFLARKTKAALRVLWCHDILTSKEQIMSGLYQTDFLFLLSDFHINNYCEQLPHLREHCVKTSNGVDLDLIEANKRPKVPKKLIYTSRPERGLINMLQMMPRIIERHPDVKLYFCTYKNDLVKQDDPVAMLARQAEAIASQMPNNVVPLGHLKKPDLYAHISSSQLMVYPTGFPEIFCIASSEAQACGTPIVTTNNFALSETCGPASSALIDGLPGEQAYDDRFVRVICDLLDDSDTRQRMSEAGPDWVRQQGYVWEQVAKSWERKFTEYLQKRWENNTDRILTELRRRSDLVPAIALAEKLGDKEAVELLGDEKNSVSRQGLGKSVSQQLFQEIAELLHHQPVSIHSVLEIESGNADNSFGYFLSNLVPTLSIDIHTNSIVKSGLKDPSDARGIGLFEQIPNDTYDLVVAIDVLDNVQVPKVMLEKLASLASDKGIVVFTTRSGAKDGSSRLSSPDRLWDFSAADFTSMFGSVDCDFKAVFCADGIGTGGDLLGHWIGFFKKPIGGKFASPNIDRRKYSTRPYQKLAVCMITKNEEEWLSGSLGSVSEIADSVIVADCGSTDNTRNIAGYTGASVRGITFDNFSQARNNSIEGVNADWILWIDADERLVNADNVRKYLDTTIYEGFAIRQNHLSLDKPRTFDLPVRLFRNRPHYKFTGMIHEQLEDISRQPFDDQVVPLLTLPDVDIAHFGYLNERIRKHKCSNRNMRLLIRDVQENKGRMLTWVLVMRDYLNIVKWFEDRGSQAANEPFLQQCLCAAIATYHNKFANTGHRYAELSFDVYQDALRRLSIAGLPFGDMPYPPFEIGFTLLAAFGGLDEINYAPKTRWFLCAEELKLFMQGKAEEASLALVGKLTSPRIEQYKLDCECPDPVPILEKGCDLFAAR